MPNSLETLKYLNAIAPLEFPSHGARDDVGVGFYPFSREMKALFRQITTYLAKGAIVKQEYLAEPVLDDDSVDHMLDLQDMLRRQNRMTVRQAMRQFRGYTVDYPLR
ncbi:MAG: hypothetical protein HY365_03615 [Candidatus Aenigmarchaeota archaeon]|nr:hypothetical protein [Candidatus Aenigmarchaeota archaeon]